MELRPVRENKDILYPTAKEVKKCNASKNIELSVKMLTVEGAMKSFVAPMSYMSDEPLVELPPNRLILNVRNISVIASLLFGILLVANKFLINKEKSEEKMHKLKKYRKITLIGLVIGLIIIFLITFLLIIN